VIRRSLAVAALLALFAAGCGEKDEPEVTGPPVVDGGAGGGSASTGDGRGGVGLDPVGEFDSPVYLAQPRGEHALYVVEQTGRIMRVAGDRRPEVFLDLSREVTTGSEQGLLSVAFAPDYRRSGRLYVDYTNRAGDTRVVEYKRSKRDETRADPRTARVVLKVAQPYENHNGGLLLFDRDGSLLVGLGDGGAGGDPERNGQNLGVLLGKILRIDPLPAKGKPYGIPRGNPFADEPGARPEILAYGLRNPWRFSFDRDTGALWIGDVGQDEQEEIDLLEDVESGANFGWSAFEGTARFNEDEEAPDAAEPVLTYGREGGCSVTGGYVVRDRAIASLYGRYLYGDFCVGQLRSFSADGATDGEAGDDTALGVQVPGLSSFAEDTAGHVYALSLEGPVYRLVPE
jgi:glucose/arabinose dehydrogenase